MEDLYDMFESDNYHGDDSYDAGGNESFLSPTKAFGLALSAAELIADDRPDVNVSDMEPLIDESEEDSSVEMVSLKGRKVCKKTVPAFEQMVMRKCGLL
jgi:O-succinylbenzoate synthase